MGISPWTDVAIVQTATCDHAGTSTVTDKMVACSGCGASWPTNATPPVSTLTRQVPIGQP